MIKGVRTTSLPAWPAVCLLVCLGLAPAASAQTWNVDARSIALGGIAVWPKPAGGVPEERSIAIPLGLVQMVADYKTFRSSSPDFDPFRVAQYVSDPLHFEIGRAGARESFVYDLRNGTLHPDLRAYRGFVPESTVAAGLFNPKWGKTIPVGPVNGAVAHSIFVGAGPHLDLNTRLAIDHELTDILSGAQASVDGRDSLRVADQLQGQLATALTVGYRVAFPVGASDARGFVSANVNYLVGIHYEDLGVHLRLDTDANGLVASRPADGSSPFVVDRRSSWLGRGHGLDLAGGVKTGAWEFELGGDNLATHIVWRSPTDRVYSVNNLYGPNSALAVGLLPRGDAVRVEGEPDYRASVRYSVASTLSLVSEVEHHAAASYVRGGFDLRGTHLAVRGALTRREGTLQPSVGVSLPAGPGRWIDLAAFSTTSNVEREHRLAIAASVRVPISALRSRP